MKLNTTMRPSMLPTAVCTLLPSNLLPSAPMPGTAAPVALLAAERVWAPQVHQVRIQVQAELGEAALVLVDGNKGTTGFKGSNSISSKRYTDGGSGTPPRGRPV
ncbi:hypothetical protein AB0M02_02690 [Actinoplanes sp. NPDC051861]|uniref:hypothetical protein n=1 Tax=Actinoplanes sp. NPDC051861 TaxID=3155170 RepID=UPI003420A5A5